MNKDLAKIMHQKDMTKACALLNNKAAELEEFIIMAVRESFTADQVEREIYKQMIKLHSDLMQDFVSTKNSTPLLITGNRPANPTFQLI